MWLITLGAVVICSYFLAKMTSNFIAMQFDTGVGISAPSLIPAISADAAGKLGNIESYKPILERNVFDSKSVLSDSVVSADETDGPGEDAILEGEAVKTSLSVKLQSTFSVGAGTDSRSSCIISSGGGKGEGEVYLVGDEKSFAPDTRITKILYNRVEFAHKSRLEYVELEDFTQGMAMNVPPRDEPTGTVADRDEKKDVAIEKKDEGSFVIERAEVDEAIANLDKLYTQIRAVPHFKEGKPNGLKLLSVRSGSIFSKLGLVRGDILKRINGNELDIKKGLDIFNQLKNETKLTVDLERKGSDQTLEYEIR